MTNPAEAQIVPATTAADIAAIRELFSEYASGLSMDLCFQHFAQELAALPGAYAAPQGRLLLARLANQNAGCIALRPMEAGVAEIKRLYVRPAFRRRGLARALVRHALAAAREIGYRVVRLDTLRAMDAAMALYAAFGFREVPPFREGEPEGICYFECDLSHERT